MMNQGLNQGSLMGQDYAGRAETAISERGACVAFLELLADAGAYAEFMQTAAGQTPARFAEVLRKIAGHMREREKWTIILTARREAKKPLPWERT